jgi:hypothetical protein
MKSLCENTVDLMEPLIDASRNLHCYILRKVTSTTKIAVSESVTLLGKASCKAMYDAERISIQIALARLGLSSRKVFDALDNLEDILLGKEGPHAC